MDEVHDGRVGVVDDELADREHAHEVAVALDHIQVVDRFMLGGLGAQVVDDLLHGHVVGDGRDLRSHDAASSLLAIAEERADGACLLYTHQAQEGLRLVVGEVADDVRRIVGIHHLEDVRRPLAAEVVDDVGLVLVFKGGDGERGLRVVEMLEDAGALRGAELLEHVGHIGRVEFVETLVGDREAHMREVAVEQVHVVPRDEVLGEVPADETGDGPGDALERRADTAEDAAHAHLGAQKTQLVGGLGELEVVYTDDLHALRVDDLLVEQVSGEEDLIRLQVAEAEFGTRNVQLDVVVFERADELAPRKHERGLAGAGERE